jgi:hypothetical protein
MRHLSYRVTIISISCQYNSLYRDRFTLQSSWDLFSPRFASAVGMDSDGCSCDRMFQGSFVIKLYHVNVFVNDRRVCVCVCVRACVYQQQTCSVRQISHHVYSQPVTVRVLNAFALYSVHHLYNSLHWCCYTYRPLHVSVRLSKSKLQHWEFTTVRTTNLI